MQGVGVLVRFDVNSIMVSNQGLFFGRIRAESRSRIGWLEHSAPLSRLSIFPRTCGRHGFCRDYRGHWASSALKMS